MTRTFALTEILAKVKPVRICNAYAADISKLHANRKRCLECQAKDYYNRKEARGART